MKKTETADVNLNAIIEAFELDYEFMTFYVNLQTGEIVSLTEEEDFSGKDENSDENTIPEHYLPLPDKWEINQYGIMEDFCYTIKVDEIHNSLISAIQGKGAFTKFFSAVKFYKIEQSWNTYYKERLKDIAIQFCRDNDLFYKEEPLR